MLKRLIRPSNFRYLPPDESAAVINRWIIIMKQTDKKCSSCKKEFPATLEHFQRDADRSSGLTHRCKGCRSIARKDYYQRTEKKRRLVRSMA